MFRWIAIACLALAACTPPKDQDQPDGKREIRVEPVTPRTPGGDAIEYTVRLPEPQTHYAEIEAVYPTGGADSVELMMAVWTPGSYLVREYARNIDALTATTTGGDPLTVEKTRKNRWTVQTGGEPQIVARYKLYARELSVRTNYITDEIAVINGAPTFVTLAGNYDRPHDVLLELPKSWTHSITSLDKHADGRDHHFTAPDFDKLVDSPIVAGTPAVYEFEVQGVPHRLANFGEGGIWDGPRSAKDVETLAATEARFWGVIPYDHYIYINLLLESGGGLEHKWSTLMLGSKWDTRKHDDYVGWLGLVSHEFFHTWNVKRLRPKPLGPFDYENEVHTESLWIAEGITSYYDDLLLVRAGLMKQDEYLESLSKQIENVQTGPGRLVQSLSQSSYDSWIKFYRGNENSNNTTISYYRKGAIVGFLLDAEIRSASLGRRSLDDVMRLAYERYSGEVGYTPDQFRQVAEEVAGESLESFWEGYVDGTDELSYDKALELYGLQFAPSDAGGDGDDRTADKTKDKAKADEKDDEPAGWIGAVVSADNIVDQVPRDTPAHAAGLNVGDEIVAIDSYRIRSGSLDERLARYRPGQKVTMLVTRRGRLREIPIDLAKKPATTWKLEVAPNARTGQRARLASWLAAPRN